MPLIACVPNVSEGRREDVLEHLSEEVASVRGVRLLDVASDAEQNRSVFTFVGTQTPLRHAAYRLMKAAFEHIDIRKHRGRHPRTGIVDVVPFVPLRDTSMERCVELSRRVGEELADHFGLPVYLYEQSATSSIRVSVNDIRGIGLEDFPEKIKQPEWKPDFGPARVHPTAGIVIVGARPPIISFIIELATSDAGSAQRLVEAVRKVGERPRQVKAIILDDGPRERIEVAVSLFDYKETPLHRVITAAQTAAKKNGIEIAGVRLVGLITADALVRSLNHYMQIEEFDPSQVLEFHLPLRR
jgi:glutamate formiminotransferase